MIIFCCDFDFCEDTLTLDIGRSELIKSDFLIDKHIKDFPPSVI